MAIATGPLSPYIVPSTLTSGYATGISWQTIPDQRASDAEKYAAQILYCQTATTECDTHCNQVLRATVQTETLYGPDFRVNQLQNGTTRLLLSQWPILNVIGIRVANASAFPYQWSEVKPGGWAVELPPLLLGATSVASDAGTGGQAVILGPGYVNWLNGRMGWVIEVTYTAGYPHCGIAAPASAGDVTLTVDDCTGWGPFTQNVQPPPSYLPGLPPGAGGVVQDTAAGQEPISCLAASVPYGPGTLSLASPLLYDHDPGILATALPGQIQWAGVLFAASMALTRGSTATTVQSVSGRGQSTGSGHKALREHGCALLRPFQRVI